jgi:hypothetical protein
MDMFSSLNEGQSLLPIDRIGESLSPSPYASSWRDVNHRNDFVFFLHHSNGAFLVSLYPIIEHSFPILLSCKIF